MKWTQPPWEKSKALLLCTPIPLFFSAYYYKSNICFFRKCRQAKMRKIKSICNLIRVIVDNILECVCLSFSYAYIFCVGINIHNSKALF